MESAINHLLQIHAIELVPSVCRGQGFYSHLFLIQKSSGGWRPILDLKSLNRWIIYGRFKMQSLQMILDTIRDWVVLTSIDLMEAYFHVPNHSAYWKFL